MNSIPLLNEIAIWLIVSLILWGAGYQGQQAVVKYSSQYKDLRIQVPGWIALFCGNPTLDNRVEVGRMVMQLSAFVTSVVWIPLVLAKIGFQARMGILFICFLLNLVIGNLVMIIGALVRRSQ